MPIFNDDNKVIFKSLNKLKFIYQFPDINDDIFKSIYNNLDNMPNLKYLKLVFNLKTIEKEIYENFIKKVISLKLKKIKIYYRYDVRNGNDIKKAFEYYLDDDLKELKCDISYDYSKIYIQKYNVNNFNKKYFI